MITKKRNLWKLIVSLVICQLAAGIGSLFTAPNISGWYSSLQKPSFNPPSWIFGPVWTILFILMGYSLYLIWNSESPKKNIGITVFGIQLGLNVLWSVLFFGMQNPFLAFCEIILLWIAILGSMILFWPIAKKATWFLLPYILWVSFASILNFTLWQLN